ncbi:MAG: lipase, partial [Pseudomonadota bacterium]
MKKLKRYQYERYAIACQLVYCGTIPEQQAIIEHFSQRVIVDKSAEHAARIFWTTSKKEVIVVFKGTTRPLDWLCNLCCYPAKHHVGENYYRIHWGFKRLLYRPVKRLDNPSNDYTALQDIIIQELEPLIAQGKRITFTGHSSGGALAVLMGDILEKRYPKSVKRVVTFGQPAIGRYSFKQHYSLDKRTFRICCDFDIVTFMPLIPYYFWHVGRMLWLHEEQIYENTPSHVRFAKSLSSWLLRPFTYHLMRKYIRNKRLF